MAFGFFKKKGKQQAGQAERAEQGSFGTVTAPQTPAAQGVFEDQFMDVQSEIVSLCLELAEGTPVDTIYVYGSIEDGALSFDAFYAAQGKVLTASQLAGSPDTAIEFLRLGTSDLERLDGVCKAHRRPTPTELRLVYTCATKSLDAHYEYDSICGAESDLLPNDVFLAWKDSVEEELDSALC